MRDAFLKSLPDVALRVLEIGTGPGHDAEAFVALGATTCGVDLSLEFVRRASATGAHVSLASARTLPFRAGAFDVVWSMSVLMHVPSSAITGALRELHRVLAVGGLAAIGVWGGVDVENHLAGPYEPPRLFSRRSDQRWRAMLGAIGVIEQFETWSAGDDPYWYQWALVRKTSDSTEA